MAAGGNGYVRVGHKGAAALAPENTIESLAAALAHGVDMVEFDVVDAPDGRLVLAHSREEIRAGAVHLDDALAFLASQAPISTGIDLDLKWHGFEAQVVEALVRHDCVERTIACSFFSRSLRALRVLEPELRTGISYPWDRRGISSRRLLKPVARAGAATLKRALPYRIGGMIGAAEAGAAMIHFSVLSRASVERCHALGASVFVWTVDEEALLDEVVALGVDGVISNDPRIFGSREEHVLREDHHFGA